MYIKDIIEKLVQSSQSSMVQEAIPDIIQQLVTMQTTSLLFKMLQKAPLSSGEIFPGAIHCETLLAILILLLCTAHTENQGPTNDSFEKVLDELQVRYTISFPPIRSFSPPVLKNAERIIGVCK